MKRFKEKDSLTPLADRLRPKDFSEFVGQEHLVGRGKILRQLIEKDEIPSMVFWGPPGSGKTTLAQIIAQRTKSRFVHLSAVDSGVSEIKKILEEAKLHWQAYQQRVILFVDEIHRFNKSQQAVFLPYIEKGEIIFIGATTENPSFEVISPLLSRCRVFVLKPLSPKDIGRIIKRALTDKKNGLGNYKIKISKSGLDLLIQNSNGDARIALNALEMAIRIAKPDKDGFYHLNKEVFLEVLQDRPLIYDKSGEEHYNTISAFIKSMRGSDPDAALYYLARMLKAGEDPRFIARRMVIFASEDIGNADPMALVVAVSVAQAVEFVGLPEAEINLAQGVTYLATAPKSNASYKALLLAKEDLEKTLNIPIPLHLRNAPTQLLKDLGYGKGYLYPHDFPQAKVKQNYLPKELKGKKYYQKEK
jgi:putative ATPase